MSSERSKRMPQPPSMGTSLLYHGSASLGRMEAVQYVVGPFSFV
jgi:hypothetical protein